MAFKKNKERKVKIQQRSLWQSDYSKIWQHSMYKSYNLNIGIGKYINKYKNAYFYIMIVNFESLHTQKSIHFEWLYCLFDIDTYWKGDRECVSHANKNSSIKNVYLGVSN